MRSFFFLAMCLCIGLQAADQDSLPIKTEDSVSAAPVYLYKILSADDWAKSCTTVHLSDADADFIHFSTKDQLNGILKKYWANASEYVVLRVETSKLPGNLVLEVNPGGSNKYYHLYDGSIPLSAIDGLYRKRI